MHTAKVYIVYSLRLRYAAVPLLVSNQSSYLSFRYGKVLSRYLHFFKYHYFTVLYHQEMICVLSDVNQTVVLYSQTYLHNTVSMLKKDLEAPSLQKRGKTL